MKKQKIAFSIGIILFVLIIIVLLFGQTKNLFTTPSSKDDDNTFVYSNLMDDESKLKAQQLLKEHNISQENIDIFFDLVDEFNSVPYRGLVEQGWRQADIQSFLYVDENAYEHLDAQPNQDLISCRNAAFLLLKDNITFKETEIIPEKKYDGPRKLQFATESDILHYDLLFATIESNGTASSDSIVKQITEYWGRAGIKFPKGNIQLLMAYADTLSGIQNFHTAIVIYSDECVWLLEKYDPLYPYQFSCFNNQGDLLNYFKKRVSKQEYAAIFSNDICLWKK